jgi:hypothetical protein
MSTSNKKILVSMIAYREKNLAQSVRSCYDSADNPENLYFSVVAEQGREDLHENLDFISEDQITYRKYDLSEYRGVLWSRHKTTEVDFEYDYILYTCGHNLFAQGWDTLIFTEYEKAKLKCEKAIITVAGPHFKHLSDGSIAKETLRNDYRPVISSNYIPGHGFPEQVEVPELLDVIEDTYVQFSWVFAPKNYVKEVPLDPDMNYHGEEIYVTIQSWCRGWRFYTTSEILYYHDTYKEYPDEEHSRMATHRPWSDGNKDSFWAQSDRSMLKLNQLLSGRLDGPYGNISKSEVLDYCAFSGLNPTLCEPNDSYDKLDVQRHAEDFRYQDPIIIN